MMSSRPRTQSLDRYNGGDDDGPGGVASAGVGSGRRPTRTPSSDVADGWTSDNDVTDSAWQRTVQSSSSTNPGQLALVSVTEVVKSLAGEGSLSSTLSSSSS